MTVDEFVTLVGAELGLPVTPDDIHRSLDAIPGWDSLLLLSLLSALERATGRRMSLAAVLEAPTLARVHSLATGERAA